MLLLKTRTVPDDGYDDYFTTQPADSGARVRFKPIFVPVLEHMPNTQNLVRLEDLLRAGEPKRRYGGMIFTSQRAVEGWRGVVERVEDERGMVCSLLSSIIRSSMIKLCLLSRCFTTHVRTKLTNRLKT